MRHFTKENFEYVPFESDLQIRRLADEIEAYKAKIKQLNETLSNKQEEVNTLKWVIREAIFTSVEE